MRFISGLLVLLFLASCSGGDDAFLYKAYPTTYNEIIRQSIENSEGESYYVYVPTTYTPEESAPIIVCFSPSGDGKTAVDSLRWAAESFGYIVAGSNDIRNNYGGNGNAVKNLIFDLQGKYTIDKNRIYACGFSGGARLATIMGDQGVVKGVISCSAGPGNSRFLDPFPWYGLGGKSDFNFNEMQGFDVPDNMKEEYFLQVHNKGHEWPSEDDLYDAVAFLHEKSMENGTLKTNDAFITSFLYYLRDKVEDLKLEKHWMDAYRLADQSSRVYATYMDVVAFDLMRDEIAKSPGYELEKIRMRELDELNDKLLSSYAAAFLQMDQNWWKSELGKLNQRIEGATGDTKYSLMRVKGSLGIIGYMYSKRFVEDDRPEAKQALTIYETLEPENPDVYFFKALYAHKHGKTTEAKANLQKSIDFGMSKDDPRLQSFAN